MVEEASTGADAAAAAGPSAASMASRLALLSNTAMLSKVEEGHGGSTHDAVSRGIHAYSGSYPHSHGQQQLQRQQQVDHHHHRQQQQQHHHHHSNDGDRQRSPKSPSSEHLHGSNQQPQDIARTPPPQHTSHEISPVPIQRTITSPTSEEIASASNHGNGGSNGELPQFPQDSQRHETTATPSEANRTSSDYAYGHPARLSQSPAYPTRYATMRPVDVNPSSGTASNGGILAAPPPPPVHYNHHGHYYPAPPLPLQATQTNTTAPTHGVSRPLPAPARGYPYEYPLPHYPHGPPAHHHSAYGYKDAGRSGEGTSAANGGATSGSTPASSGGSQANAAAATVSYSSAYLDSHIHHPPSHHSHRQQQQQHPSNSTSPRGSSAFVYPRPKHHNSCAGTDAGTAPRQDERQEPHHHMSYDMLARENMQLRDDLKSKDQTIAELQQRLADTQRQVAELRQLPTGKISHIPIDDMMRIMETYGSEVSNQTLPRRRNNVKKASIIRQFRRWNPEFFRYFVHVNGEWVPKLGKEGELRRREEKRRMIKEQLKSTSSSS